MISGHAPARCVVAVRGRAENHLGRWPPPALHFRMACSFARAGRHLGAMELARTEHRLGP